jgi:hypothetical protein
MPREISDIKNVRPSTRFRKRKIVSARYKSRNLTPDLVHRNLQTKGCLVYVFTN